MNELNKAVSIARRRMAVGHFFSILTWAAFVSLLIAAVGVAIPKIWHLEFIQSEDQKSAWIYCWTLGAIVIGFLVAAIVTYRRLGSRLAVASEVDHRFGLKERVSSALAIPAEVAEGQVGQALIKDAVNRVETIEVSEKFELRPRWSGLLPLIPIAIISLLMFLPDAQLKANAAGSKEAMDKEKVKLKVEAFKKKIEQARKQIEAKGLADASEDVKAIAEKFDKLNSDNLQNRKQALVKINDIKKEIEERQKSIGNSKSFRDNLNKLKDTGKGVAKKIADALADGKFEDADKAIKDLAKKLKEGKLSKAEAKQVANQLKELADQMKKAAEQRQQKIDDLQKQIEKATAEGDLDKAAQLQQQKEAAEQNNKQQQNLDNIAKQLQNAAEAMQNGDPGQMKKAMQQAAEAMEGMGEDLEDLKQQMEDMQNLQDLEDMIDGLKQPGEGDCDCEGDCEGDGNGGAGQGKGKGDGNGGTGQGLGARPFEEDETSGFKSGVRGKVGRGEKVVTGNADGQNITGRTTAEVAELIQATETVDTDPTENQKLSRKHREHAEQYFKALRDQ